jgi:glycosyltransferase involved in cell wall biosynthesis
MGLIIYGDLSQKTGGYLYDRMMVDYLQRRGDIVEIISLSRDHYLKNISHNFSSPLLHRLKDLNIEILLEDELCHPSLFFLNKQLKDEVDYALFSIVHNLSFNVTLSPEQKKIYQFFEERYLNTIDGFIFNSQATRTTVENLLNRPVLSVVAYPGKDHLRIKNKQKAPAKIASLPLNLLFIGNLSPNKGLDILIKALAGIDKSHWKLTILGDTTIDLSYTRKIRTMTQNLNVIHNIDFKGAVSHDQLPDFYEQSDVLVVPSFYEGFGIVYVEALGFGIPVLATNTGGATEIITHEKEGFLVEPGDSERIASYILHLIDYPEEILQMSRAANQRFSQLPSWNESMKKIRRFLHSYSS